MNLTDMKTLSIWQPFDLKKRHRLSERDIRNIPSLLTSFIPPPPSPKKDLLEKNLNSFIWRTITDQRKNFSVNSRENLPGPGNSAVGSLNHLVGTIWWVLTVSSSANQEKATPGKPQGDQCVVNNNDWIFFLFDEKFTKCNGFARDGQ